MSDNTDGSKYGALEMIGRFGSEAAHVASGLAEKAEEHQRGSAQA